jgi:hypothetical protein
MGVLAIAVTYLMMLLVTGWPLALIWVGIWYLLRKRSSSTRTFVLVPLATLFFTPGWGPATIAIVPVPFGLLFGIAAISFHWAELASVMKLAPTPYWYFIAFPVTAVVAYGLWKFVLSNYSFQRTRCARR